MSSTQTLTVSAADAGKRLDVFVGESLSLSRAAVKELFDADRVRLQGRRARKGDRVEAGQTVTVELAEPMPPLVPDASVPLNVLHEDEALVFVDKPGGAPSHPLRAGETGTVANALLARYPECAAASEDSREGGLCHRLDIETSGVLLAARNRQAWRAVRESFASRAVDKRYLALVTGPIADDGEIDLPLEQRGDRVTPAPSATDGGREALSRFRVLARRGEHALVEVQIVTGVMHQVRAHLAAIGAPIVGDALYGGKPEPALSRFFLHAVSLELSHPTTGKRIKVESPLPAELEAVRQRVFGTPAK